MKIKSFLKKNSSIIITYILAFVLLTFVSVMRPGYASVNNLRTLAASAGILGLTALGQTFVILTGGMDLSIPWMLTMSAFIVGGVSGGDGAKLLVAIPTALLAGAAMGLFNGLGVAYVGIAPVIMTMASNIIFQGLLIGTTGGTPGGAAPDILQKFSTSSIGPFSYVFIAWIAVSAAAMVVFIKMRYGRKLYAVGNNPTVAYYSGINEKLVITCAYVLSGLMAALAGVVYSGRLSQMYLGMGDSYQMDSISAVAIGGIALAGGSGSYMGTIAGVLILTILNGVLSALNLEMSVRKIIYGIVLFLAVLISNKKRAE